MTDATIPFESSQGNSNFGNAMLQGTSTLNANIAHHALILKTYYKTPWLKQVFRVFLEELNEKLKFEDTMYTFFEDFFLQLKLFGYVVYREKKYGVEVLNGTDVILMRDPKTYKIVPVFTAPFQKTRGWHVTIARMPRFNRSGAQIHSNGAGASCLDAALEILLINNNAIHRDIINSRPTIYTRVSNQLKPSGQQARPWFHAMHSQMVPSTITGTMDFSTLIRARGETLQQLDDLSSTYRASEASHTANKHHKELVVSDGREMNEARHLHHEPAWMNWRVAQLQNQIAEIWQIPPAAFGQNINSERQAGASRLSEVVLLRWERHLRKMAAFFVAVGKILNLKIDSNICLSHYDMHQLERIAKPEYVKKMYSCVFGVDEKNLSLDLIKQLQAGGKPGEKQGNLQGFDQAKNSNNKSSEEKTELRTQRANGQ